MPIRKRVRRSRKLKRYLRKPRLSKTVRTPPFYLKRKFSWYVNSWAFATTTTADFWKYLSIQPSATIGTFPTQGIPGFSQYAVLFEQYRIKAIKYTFRPQFNVVNQPGNATVAQTQSLAYLTTCVDPEANTGPSGVYGSASLVALQADGRARTRTFTKPLTVYIAKPMVYQDAGGVAAALRRKAGWINTGYGNVDHRGVHVYWHQVGFDNNPTSMDVYCTVYMEFKGMNAG